MVTCCALRTAHVALGCYEWCEVNKTTVLSDFTSCLDQNELDNQSTISGLSHGNRGRVSPMTVTGLMLGVLLLGITIGV